MTQDMSGLNLRCERLLSLRLQVIRNMYFKASAHSKIRCPATSRNFTQQLHLLSPDLLGLSFDFPWQYVQGLGVNYTMIVVVMITDNNNKEPQNPVRIIKTPTFNQMHAMSMICGLKPGSCCTCMLLLHLPPRRRSTKCRVDSFWML